MKGLPNTSYWMLTNLEKSENLQEGQEIVYLLQDKNTAGVRKEKVLRKVMLAKDQLTLIISRQSARLPSELIQEEADEFRSLKVNKKTVELKPQDFEALEYDEYVERKGLTYVDAYMDDLEVKHLNNPNKFRKLKGYKDRRRRPFDSYVQATEKKT